MTFRDSSRTKASPSLAKALWCINLILLHEALVLGWSYAKVDGRRASQGKKSQSTGFTTCSPQKAVTKAQGTPHAGDSRSAKGIFPYPRASKRQSRSTAQARAFTEPVFSWGSQLLEAKAESAAHSQSCSSARPASWQRFSSFNGSGHARGKSQAAQNAPAKNSTKEQAQCFYQQDCILPGS